MDKRTREEVEENETEYVYADSKVEQLEMSFQVKREILIVDKITSEERVRRCLRKIRIRKLQDKIGYSNNYIKCS